MASNVQLTEAQLFEKIGRLVAEVQERARLEDLLVAKIKELGARLAAPATAPVAARKTK